MYGQVLASISQTLRSSSSKKSNPIISNLNPGRFLGSINLMQDTWQSIMMSLILWVMWDVSRSGYFCLSSSSRYFKNEEYGI